MFSLVAIGLASILGLTQDPERSPGFDVWGSQVGVDFYTNLVADCDTFSHRHGRNAAWGLWEMPLFAVEDDGGKPGQGTTGVLTLRCIDGTGCVSARRARTARTQLDSHVLTFGTLAGAQAFSARLNDLRAACEPPSP